MGGDNLGCAAAARMWQLGAIASVDRWDQVTVEPFEGPLPRGAAPDTSVSWRSAEDRRRSHAFARRASFVEHDHSFVRVWSCTSALVRVQSDQKQSELLADVVVLPPPLLSLSLWLWLWLWLWFCSTAQFPQARARPFPGRFVQV